MSWKGREGMVSEFDQAFLTPEQVAKIEEYKKMYAEGQATGNQTMMDAAHAGAEAERATANYSGNTDGSGYIPLSAPSANTADTYNATYNNNSNGYIEEMYRQKQEAQEAALRSAYEQNVNTLNATKEKIPGQYQEARNAAAGQAAVQRSNFNEYAAASGLNSGAGGQAQLAFSNALQGNLSGLDKAQANALSELDLQMANLETSYRNAVQQAIAQGEFDKAQALYQEFQNQRSLATQQAQFDQTMGYNYATLNYDKTSGAQAAALVKAQTLAQYGDFSGYRELGWTDEQIAAMEAAYAALKAGGYS
jgi:hypothetical protein